MIDRLFEICNNWNSFHNDIENVKSNLSKNAYPSFLIDKVIKKYLDSKFKIQNYFSYKDPIPNDSKSFLVYKFTCASCSSSYIGETCRHFKTRVEEHIKNDNKAHIFKHLRSSTTCFDSYNCLVSK